MVISGVVMWRLRLVSRNPLSHLHLHLRADVAERVTLANTYLSLPGSEEGLGAEEVQPTLMVYTMAYTDG